MKLKLHTQIFLGIVLGVLAGVLFREQAVVFKPIGEMFIRLLKMVIVPLVFASLVMGIVNVGSIQSLGRMGIRTTVYYLITTIIAVMTGMLMINTIQPGVGSNLHKEMDLLAVVDNGAVDFVSVITEIVPENIFATMVNENMLGLIFFSMVFGCALAVLGRKVEPISKMISSLNDVMLKITDWIMLLSPIGVFALMATLVGETGLAAFKPLTFYMVTVLLGLGFHLFVNLSCVLLFVAKYSPVVFFQKMFPALATGFSTDSSIATLPVTMDCLEKNVGVSNQVAGFVAPLGATVNMDGTALYEAVAAMFIAQVYGIELTIIQQVIISITAVLASIGTAGIPSAGLITMAIVLKSVNLPLEGVGLILAVDRVLDMCRTIVNVFGDACGALVIAKMEGERIKV
jgi:proton glutamate symport protein